MTTIIHSQDHPWYNKSLSIQDDSIREFIHVLTHNIKNVKLSDPNKQETPNIYTLLGYAKQGYSDFESVLNKFDSLINKLNCLHPEGWFLLCHGDGKRDYPSIYNLIKHAEQRGIPVIVNQSHFGYSEQGTPYWPEYARACLFGEGKYNINSKGEKQECWAGYVSITDSDGSTFQTGDVSLPDMLISTLTPYINGIVVVGGGDLSHQECIHHKFLKNVRNKDVYIDAKSLNGDISIVKSYVDKLKQNITVK
jgi:hypothetical protein